MKGIIYGLVDTDTMELRYVGQTTQSLAKRFNAHMRLRSSNIHLNNWLRTADVSAIVLERIPVDLDEAEMCWIADMRAAGTRLLNITDGGGGINGYTHSAKSRAKMSIANTGRVVSDTHKTKLSTAAMGHSVNAETRAKISVAMRGKQHAMGHICSIEARAKISAAKMSNQNARGHILSVEVRAVISASLRKYHAKNRT